MTSFAVSPSTLDDIFLQLADDAGVGEGATNTAAREQYGGVSSGSGSNCYDKDEESSPLVPLLEYENKPSGWQQWRTLCLQMCVSQDSLSPSSQSRRVLVGYRC